MTKPSPKPSPYEAGREAARYEAEFARGFEDQKAELQKEGRRARPLATAEPAGERE
jgi:hypothetical protein